MVPSSIGPYRIIEGLGSGANGEVYLAEDTRLGRKVAVKTLSALGSKELADARRWVLREARAAARLNHPNIASVYDVLETPDGAHIVMEYVRGDTLAARLRGGPLPPDQVLEIAIQLADALSDAHAVGVVHRDLKPANVVITPRGNVKVLDFGLAQVRAVEPGSTPVRSSKDFTLDGRQVGTPPYMPPEHLMGDPVDARGDIYSFGVMLYELLTGRRPFAGADAMALTMAILTQPTPRASGSNAAVPPALDAIVFRAMSRLPQDRYASVAEMAADLRRAQGRRTTAVADARLSDAPTKGYASARDVLDQRPIEAHLGVEARAVFGMRFKTLIVAVALAALVGLLWILRRPVEPVIGQAARIAVLPCQNIGSPDDDYWADGLTEAIINDISMFPNLRVISRSAVMRYKNKPADPREVSRELGVDSLLESSFQRAATHLRISARLIRANDGFEMWAGRYDRPAAGIFDVQDAVATQIARALHVQLDPDVSRRKADVGTRDLRAYELYLQGRYFFYQYDRPSIERAIQLYRMALMRDDNFGLAHAGLSLCYSEYSNFLWDLNPIWLDRAVEAAQKALETAPNQAEAHFALAFAHHQRGEFEPALREFERTVSLNPSHAHAHAEIAMIQYQSYCRFQHSLQEYEVALSLDPYLLTALWYQSYLYGLMGNFTEAATLLGRARQLNPESEYTLMFSAVLSDISGNAHEGRRTYEQMLAKAVQNPLLHWLSGLSYEFFDNYPKALGEFDATLRLNPNYFLARAGRARALYRMRRYAEALAASEDALNTHEVPAAVCKSCQLWFSRPVAQALHAAILGALGRRHESEQEFQALRSKLEPQAANACVAYQLARACAVAGSGEESLVWLRRAIDGGCAASALFRIEPDFKALRNDARFAELIKTKVKS